MNVSVQWEKKWLNSLKNVKNDIDFNHCGIVTWVVFIVIWSQTHKIMSKEKFCSESLTAILIRS